MEKEGGWVSVGKNLLRSRGFVKDGVCTPLTLTEKMVLVFMDDRAKLFIATLGREHYETQESIGKGLDIERKTVARCLKKLIGGGLVLATKKGRGYSYHGVDITKVILYYPNDNETEGFEEFPITGE